MAKPTAAQVKAQLAKTQAANQGNQPTAETLQKRAVRQGERAELTKSQQQLTSSAYAQKTAQEDAIIAQQQAQSAPQMTGTDYRNALMGLSSRAVGRNNSDIIQNYSSQFRSRAVGRDNTDIYQDYVRNFYGGMSGRGLNRNISIENPTNSPIKARTSAGSITKKDPFAQEPKNTDIFNQQTVTSPVFLNPERVNPSADLSGKVPQYSQEYLSQQAWEQQREDAKPFGALSVDENGVAYYGTGVKGWIRKTWADLADPNKYKYDIYELTPEEQKRVTDNYNANIADSAQILNERLNWDSWGKNLFGLSAEEVATFTSARGLETDIAKQTGQNLVGMTASRMVRLGVDTTQNLIWGGLDVLGLDDTAVRKMQAYTTSIDAIADKFKKDEEGFFTKLSASPVARFLLPPLQVVHGLNTAQDWLTVAKNGQLEQANPFDKSSTASQYLAGSAMAYSMVWDEMSRAQFEKGLAEGKDPGELAQSYANPGIELAGSILGSPSTYFGLTLKAPAIFTKAGRAEGLIKSLTTWKTVVSVPTFGEIFGLGVGKARLAASAARFDGVASEFRPIVEALQSAEKLPESQIASQLDTIVKQTAEAFDNQRKFRGNLFTQFASYDSAGKISVASRDANLFIGSLTGSEGVAGTLEILSDMVRARKGGEEAIRATERLLQRSDAGVFSEVGNMVGEILSRLDDTDLLAITKKYAGSPEASKLHAEVMGKVQDVLEEFIPSVDDMLSARSSLPEIAKKLKMSPSELSKMIDAGQDISKITGKLDQQGKRALQLAQMANDLPMSVKAIRGITRVPQKLAQMQSGFMIQSFMSLMPRSTAKNVWGQIVPIAFQTGLTSALRITADSLLGGLNQNILGKLSKMDNVVGKVADAASFESSVARKVDRINELIGFLPGNEAGLEKAISKKSDLLGGLLQKVTGGFLEGQLPKMGRMEELASLGIIENVLKQEIQKALPAVTKNLPEYEAFMKTLPQEQRGLFTHLLDVHYGKWDNAVEDLRKLTSTGEIEAWRVTPLSPTLRKELDRMGFLETFYDMQKNADEPEKLKQFLDEFETSYRQAIEAEAKKLPSTMQKPPQGEEEFFEMLEMRPGRQNDFIRELYQSAQNMRNKLDEVTYAAKNNLQNRIKTLSEQIQQSPELAQQLGADIEKATSALQNADSKFRAIEKEMMAPQENLNKVLEQTKKWYFDVYSKQGQSFTPEQMAQIWNKKINLMGGETYRLADIFPQVKPEQLTADALVDLMWNSQRNHRADKWWFYNNKKYTNTMQALKEMAEELGTSLDEIALLDKSPTNPYFELQKLQMKYQTAEEMFSWQRYLDQFTALPETKLSQLAGDAKGRQLNAEYITRIVNTTEAAKTAPRKANPLAYIKENGGINPEDFKNIFGESNASGVLPGLMKKNARAIDDVGIRLWEGGFISREQADDYEYIREYLRGFQKGFEKTDAQINADEAAYWLEQAGQEIIPYENITLSQAREALQNLRFVPSYDGGQISEARVAYEGMDNFLADVQRWGDKVTGEWGKTIKSSFLENEDAMRTAQKAYESRMSVVRRKAAVVSVSTRNFALHDYNKTYFDHALTMMLGNSLHYWSTRSYMRSIETLIDNPKIANTYMAYKEYMTREHSDMPEWYRYNIDVGALMGIDSNNQYFINLESAINPMNGLTGVDFDDPQKRVDWMSRLVADVGKMGVGVSPIYQWALALKLNEQGKAEAAQRWAGRLLPFSQTVKSVTSGLDNVLNKFGANVDTKPIEIDPFVLLFGEGETLTDRMQNSVDPYERNKVVAALAMMVDEGQITEEQMIEAARDKSGDLWQAAMERASDARAGGDVEAFFLGSAMKPRTADDMKIEKFWQDYSKLQAARSQMSPDEYRQAFTQMHNNPEYGSFVDGLLLSRKTGDAMDSAYTYNVLGRIPPGQMNDIAEIAGIDPEHIALFYEMKGDFSKMGLSESDLAAFQAGIADIAATYQIPATATRQEWNYATSLYSQMRTELQNEFGADIQDRISAYYDIQSTAEKQKYLENNPEVREAMARQTEYITNTPVLMQYYGSQSTLEQYYSNQTKEQLASKYSSDVITDASMLYDKNTSEEQRQEILRQYSPLRQYQYEYGNADLEAAAQLESKYGDMTYAMELYNSERAIRDYAYRKEIDRQYGISRYKRELNTLTKQIRKDINSRYDPQLIADAKVYGQISDADRKNELESKYSELESYLNEKSELYDQNFQDILDYGGYLPDAPTAEVRTDANPNGDTQQENLYNLAVNPVPEKTFEEWTVEIGTPAAELIQDSWENNGEVPYEAMKRLGYEAERLGYSSADDLLLAILMSLKQ